MSDQMQCPLLDSGVAETDLARTDTGSTVNSSQFQPRGAVAAVVEPPAVIAKSLPAVQEILANHKVSFTNAEAVFMKLNARFTLPLIVTTLGCWGFALLALWNDLGGKKALLLDLGRGKANAFTNFFLWFVAVPCAIWWARETKKKIHDSNSSKIQAQDHQEFNPDAAAKYWKRSTWWSFSLAFTVWCLVALESYIFFKSLTKADLKLGDLLMPMIFLGLFIAFLFRYFAMVARLVQASITAAVDEPAIIINKWIDDQKQKAGWEFDKKTGRIFDKKQGEKVTRTDRQELYEICNRADPLNWKDLLFKFYDGIQDARNVWKDFFVFFHVIVSFSFVYVALAGFNITRQAIKLNDFVKDIADNGAGIVDILSHHALDQTHHIVTVAEDHFTTVLLMVLNFVYLGFGIWTLFETMMLMGTLNSTRGVSNAAEKYFRHRREMNDGEKEEFFRFVNMMTKLKATSPIARLFGFPVTRAFVVEWITHYVLKLPLFFIFLSIVIRKANGPHPEPH